jgi:hypothetical protein
MASCASSMRAARITCSRLIDLLQSKFPQPSARPSSKRRNHGAAQQRMHLTKHASFTGRVPQELISVLDRREGWHVKQLQGRIANTDKAVLLPARLMQEAEVCSAFIRGDSARRTRVVARLQIGLGVIPADENE